MIVVLHICIYYIHHHLNEMKNSALDIKNQEEISSHSTTVIADMRY